MFGRNLVATVKMLLYLNLFEALAPLYLSSVLRKVWVTWIKISINYSVSAFSVFICGTISYLNTGKNIFNNLCEPIFLKFILAPNCYCCSKYVDMYCMMLWQIMCFGPYGLFVGSQTFSKVSKVQ